ncbi:hypothetical protein IIA15_03090 [candidate division TA06 bacterium]|nr:hypothetical protein [candidate division TA06 bacterium]
MERPIPRQPGLGLVKGGEGLVEGKPFWGLFVKTSQLRLGRGFEIENCLTEGVNMSKEWNDGELREAWEKWDESLQEAKQEVNKWLDQVGSFPQTEKEIKRDLWVLEGLIGSLGKLRDLSRGMLAELLLLRLCGQSAPLPSEEKELQNEELPFMH